MCGIAGIIAPESDGTTPVGSILLQMASCLQHRGTDSAGIAIFREQAGRAARLQVALPPGASLPEPQAVLALGNGRLSDLIVEAGGFSAAVVPGSLDADSELVLRLEEQIPGCVVLAMGRAIRIFKGVGPAVGLTTAVEALCGTHGIAHLRLATESRIDPAHAQPFWGRPFPDIAVTHNGHITNYYKMRRRFEERGFSFASRNDSEIIGVYLGEKMAEGASLLEALTAATRDLDGSYSFIAATAACLGVARDPFATKPLLYSETPGLTALASEPQALHRLLGDEIVISEIKPREVRVWEKA